MTTIVEFLTARLDWAEAVALAAQKSDPTPWSANVSTAGGGPTDHEGSQGAGLVIAANEIPLWDHEGSNTLCMTVPTAAHVALHDPASVLREVKAKRELIEGWRRHFEWYMRDENDEAAGAAWAAMDNVLVTLAGAYRTHPDYAGDQVGDWAWPDPDDKARRADAT